MIVENKELSSLRTPFQARHYWYDAYREAMLESDERKILLAVAAARKAIEDRLAELSIDHASVRERRDLDDALKYLGMFLELATKTGDQLIWC